MGDVGEYWKDHKDHVRKQREKTLAETSKEGWSFHTEYHWYRMVNDKKLDFWPSTGKWQYDGRVYHSGDVLLFIEEKERGRPSLDRVLTDGPECLRFPDDGVKIKETFYSELYKGNNHIPADSSTPDVHVDEPDGSLPWED